MVGPQIADCELKYYFLVGAAFPVRGAHGLFVSLLGFGGVN